MKEWAKEYLEYLEFKRVNNFELFGADFALSDLAKAILAESEQQMTNYNERLDEILDGIFWTGHKWAIDRLDRTPSVVLGEAKQAIIDWHNKQVETVLDRLQVSIDDGKKSHSMAVIRGAIEAEHNKLKEANQ